MDTKQPNLPAPGIEFRVAGDSGLDASARLDWMALGGLCVDFHEQRGADEYLVTISREGMRVTFSCSLFHLSALNQALGLYVKRVRKERGLLTIEDLAAKTES